MGSTGIRVQVWGHHICRNPMLRGLGTAPIPASPPGTCAPAPWGNWGPCSRSCGLGVALRQALPGGGCARTPPDTRICTPRVPPRSPRDLWVPPRIPRTPDTPICSRWSQGSGGQTLAWGEQWLRRGTGGGYRDVRRSSHSAPPAVPGGWAAWGSWSPCDATCGGGVRSRERSCSDPPPKNGGPCTGPHLQTRDCNTQPCHGAPWSPCAPTCGGLGLSTRQRVCTSPTPAHGGRDCTGAHTDTMYSPPCPVDGAWSPWSPWSRCDRTCGGGRSLRSRSCTRPPPKNGGEPCPGERHQLRLCNPQPCGRDTAPAHREAPGSPGSPRSPVVSVPPPGQSCPPGTVLVPCANRCPRHCGDLRAGLSCGPEERCLPGCRCPDGECGPARLGARSPAPVPCPTRAPVRRAAGAGRRLRAPRPLRVHGRGRARVGAREPPPRRVRELRV
uniref:Uncharacterized protein n=1 Tax=Melopsittacus undulatus TaxID=13146 RepID=A0A8V5G6K1_MELUD